MNKTFRAIVSVLVVAAVMLILSGCQEKQVTKKTEVEIETEHVIEQHPIVE